MNGSENGYAGALFFALISLGAVLKIDNFTGVLIGAGGAILAAISLRYALNKSAQATEENHQRMEVQFQQLRTKIIETSSATTTAMDSLSEVSQLLQENLKIIRAQSNSFDNLISLVESFKEINMTLAGLEENSAAVNIELEKISIAIQSQEKFSDSEGLKKLIAVEETNRANLQSVLKILSFVAQMMKAPAYAKALDRINSTIEKLAAQMEKNPSYTKELAEIHAAVKELVAQIENNPTYIEELAEIHTAIEKLGTLKTSADDANKNLSELVGISGALSRSFTTTLDDLRLDMVKLAAKLEELNDLINKNIRAK